MENLKLNETPRRTSRNFNINNIKLENIEIPEKLEEVKNIEISKSEGVKIKNETSNSNLKYGIDKKLENLVGKISNLKLHVELEEKENNLDIKLNQNVDLMENIEVVANENTNSQITLKYETENDLKLLHNGIIRVNAKKNSNVKVSIINFTNLNSNIFLSIENNIEENANVEYVIVDFGGKNSLTNYYSNILGKNANNSLNTIYLGRDNQVFDLNYIAELYGEKSNIDIDVQGALKDTAKKHFKGTIDFKKGCKKATGNENENCMLLSDKAKSIALPMLLCSEEDVEGNHSSSAGKVGEKELFYIMSRGFSKVEAMKLLVRAKFNNILEKIEDEELKEEIIAKIDEGLN